ncbi:MAG: M23 family metallopeptidase [Alphaproteobacteria bacterium]|nr:M23 family metallopeptidase [Alphaproteobacteria bacterium]
MSTSPMAGLMALAHRLFPHRQFYLRSRGSVQFFEFTPTFQMTVAATTLFVLGWVAYASVVVIFKEQIITAKDQRYASMQAAYEGRVSQMQLAYDELNGLLVLAEERFQNATRDLESKHRQLTALLMQKQAMDKQIRQVRTQVAVMGNYAGRSYAQASSPDGANTLMMQFAEAEPAVRQSRAQQNISDSAIGKVANATLAGGKGSGAKSVLSGNYVVQRIAGLEDRLNNIQKQQLALLGELRDSASGQIDRYQRVIAMTGLNVEAVANQVGVNSRNGRGGPLVPLGAEIRLSALDGVTDEFEKQFAEIAQTFGRLDNLTSAVARLPLVTPIEFGLYRGTSGFGYRVDPFTGRVAFHSGADMAGEYGTPILASLPGRVINAENRGPYGLMVEIDHGHGIRTRFGHLKSVLVKVGDMVQFRQKIATMGSSGRSTGPHLHYEIWFNDVVRDPTKFFDAGRNVFKG